MKGHWVPEEDAFDLCRAILRLFRDEGELVVG